MCSNCVQDTMLIELIWCLGISKWRCQIKIKRKLRLQVTEVSLNSTLCLLVCTLECNSLHLWVFVNLAFLPSLVRPGLGKLSIRRFHCTPNQGGKPAKSWESGTYDWTAPAVPASLTGVHNTLVLIFAVFFNTCLQREWISLMLVCVPTGATSQRNYLEKWWSFDRIKCPNPLEEQDTGLNQRQFQAISDMLMRQVTQFLAQKAVGHNSWHKKQTSWRSIQSPRIFQSQQMGEGGCCKDEKVSCPCPAHGNCKAPSIKLYWWRRMLYRLPVFSSVMPRNQYQVSLFIFVYSFSCLLPHCHQLSNPLSLLLSVLLAEMMMMMTWMCECWWVFVNDSVACTSKLCASSEKLSAVGLEFDKDDELSGFRFVDCGLLVDFVQKLLHPECKKTLGASQLSSVKEDRGWPCISVDIWVWLQFLSEFFNF